jgi:hypothetical protein
MKCRPGRADTTPFFGEPDAVCARCQPEGWYALGLKMRSLPLAHSNASWECEGSKMRVSQGGQGWYHSNDSRTSRSAKLIVICNSGDGRFWHRTTGCARNTVRSKLG